MDRHRKPKPHPQPPPQPFTMMPGMRAPLFTGMALMPDGKCRILSLADSEYSDHSVLLVFYVSDWTHLCPTELVAFSDRKWDFNDVQCKVIFCSTSSHFSHHAWVKTPRSAGGLGRVRYPILADRNQAIAKAFGVLKGNEGVAFRASFLIDRFKVIKHVSVSDVQVGRGIPELLRTVQAFYLRGDSGDVYETGGWRGGGALLDSTQGDESWIVPREQLAVLGDDQDRQVIGTDLTEANSNYSHA